MATIGGISYMLTAKTSEFVRKMRKAGRAVSDFARKMANGVGRLAKWGAAVAAAGIAIGGYFVKQQMKAMDEISKLSDELGISTEALAGFQHGASLTGTSTETLTKGLQRMVRVVGEAREGYGTAIKGFRQLGISMDEVRQNSPEQLLGIIADRLNAIVDPTRRAAGAYAIFGRQGQELMNFLMQGSKGMEEVRQEAEKLGLTFSREMGMQVEMANDAMDRLGKIITGIARQIAPEFAAIIKVIGDRILDWATSGEGAAGKMKSAFSGLGLFFAAFADNVELIFTRMDAMFTKVGMGIRHLVGLAMQAAATIDRLMPQFFKDAGESLTGVDFGQQARDFKDALDAQNLAAEQSLRILEERMRVLEGVGEGTRVHAMNEAILGLQEDINDKLEEQANQIKRAQLADYFKSAIQPAKDVLATMRAIGGSVRKFGAAQMTEKASEATKSMWDGLVAATNKMGAQTAAMLRASMPDRVLATDAIGSFSARQIGSMQSSRDREVAMRLDEERNEHLREIANYLEKGIPAP